MLAASLHYDSVSGPSSHWADNGEYRLLFTPHDVVCALTLTYLVTLSLRAALSHAFPRSHSLITWPVKASLVFCRVSGCTCSGDWEDLTIRKRQGTFQSLVRVLETRRRGGLLVQPPFSPHPMSLLLYINHPLNDSHSFCSHVPVIPTGEIGFCLDIKSISLILMLTVSGALHNIAGPTEVHEEHLTRSCTQMGIRLGIHSVNKDP